MSFEEALNSIKEWMEAGMGRPLIESEINSLSQGLKKLEADNIGFSETINNVKKLKFASKNI